jgi:hypothetical protein
MKLLKLNMVENHNTRAILLSVAGCNYAGSICSVDYSLR